MSDTTLPSLALSADEKRAALVQLLLQRTQQRERIEPASHGQQALWFLQQSAPSSAAYHIAFSVRICSPVDAAALGRALQVLVDRHASLRTRYDLRDGALVQVIAGHHEVPLQQTDASAWSPDELHEHVLASYRQPFDLSRGPVLRAHLFSCATDDHVLLLTVHHIAHDAWSLWILLDELQAAYAAAREGAKVWLPPVERSYADHVRWQAEMLAGPSGQRLWAYWQEQLDGAHTVLDLPTDRPRTPGQQALGASLPFKLTAELSSQLKQLAHSQGATPFMLLLAAYQVFLYRITGQDDILVGSPTSGRNRAEFAGVVGYFANPVVLRGRLAGNPVFLDFLGQVRQTVLEAMAHEDYPFPLLVKNLQLPRDAACAPLVQASFVLQKPQRGGSIADGWVPSDTHKRMSWGGLELKLFDMPQQEGQFDLELELIEAGGAFHGVFKYNARLFDRERVAGMADSFSVLLGDIARQPHQQIERLSLLSASERRRLLRAPDVPFAHKPPACLHHGFEHQARRRPHAIAVTLEGHELSYGELNARANRLAHHLQSLGVGPEVLVGLCIDRSVEMVVGLLGILKAGGAYLPLDPDAPKERRAFIVADSQVTIVLTRQSMASQLAHTGAKLVLLDAELPPATPALHCAAPASAVGPGHLAYVIYTSGSTGQPKGAEITHANAARLFTSTEHAYRFDEHDVWTLFHSIAFDFSVWELWGALLYGGRVVIVPHAVSRAPDDFLQLLARERVTVLNQTPSAFRQLMQAQERCESAPLWGLRFVIFGGEQLDPQSLAPWFERHGDRAPQLVNMYGITETTVHVTHRPLSARDLASAKSVIGVPLPDLRIYLLDRHGQPVPVGIAGEIHVGGAGVGRGYLRRAELTAQKFIDDPFAAPGGSTAAKLYRSGDLARWLPNGEIEYLGRIDKQVKIRGFRIELGEIEAALCQHPGVQQAIVSVHTEPGGDKRLVAYTVGPEPQPSAVQLRQFLADKLPAYMLPSAFIALDHVPLTHHGKIDHRALPSVPLQREPGPHEAALPRNAIEQQLVRLWESVLGVQPVGIDDNFFELGGHSLLAVTLMVAVQQAFGTAPPLGALFQHPTVRQLGALLDQPAGMPAWSPVVPIQPDGSAPPFFCVAGGGGNVLYFRALAHHLGCEQPFYGLQARGLDGALPPYTSVEDIARCHVQALRGVQPRGPYFLGGHCFGGIVAFEMAQQLQRQGQTVALLAILDSPAPSMPQAAAGAAGMDDLTWLLKIARSIEEGSGQALGLTQEMLAPLDAEARLACLMDRLRAVGFLPPEAGLQHVRGLVGVSKANVHAQSGYAPDATAKLPVVLLRAGEVHPEYDYAAMAGDASSAGTLGWQRHSSAARMPVEMVPGNHLTMLSQPHVAALARQLGAHLRSSREEVHLTTR